LSLADVDDHRRAALVDICRRYSDMTANVWYAERRYHEIMASAESQRRSVDQLKTQLLASKYYFEELFRNILSGSSSVDDDDSEAS
jgi:hypothetical protein